jgi:uncharacterized RDD family membrane protein YckC
MTSKFVYAGFWLRFVAVIIDSIIIGIVSGILGAIVPPLASIINLLVAGGYYVYLESSEYQGTVGKILLGLKVTDLKGQRITPQMATIRFFGRIISGIILGIGYLMAAFTEKKQALHDLIANTLVIQKTATETTKNQTENSRPNDEAIEVTPKEKVVTAE